MALTYVPLLSLQRELYKLPRSPQRFQQYLQALVDEGSGDMALPLSAMNPMAQDHVPAYLDQLLAEDADAIAATATTDAAARLSETLEGDYRVALVVSDDLKGGWTNRYTSDFDYRFRQRAHYRRGWIPVILWVSEPYDRDRLSGEVQLAIFRTAHVQRHGEAQTLRQLIAQEAQVMAQAGVAPPSLTAEDLAYTQTVLANYQGHTDMPTVMVALYGDRAAHALGYPPLGLSPDAGFALAAAPVHCC